MTYKEAMSIIVDQSRLVISVNEGAAESGKPVDWHSIAVGLIDAAEKLMNKCK